MAHAAAAVVGARRGRLRGGPPVTSFRQTSSAATGPNVATGVASCACTILVSAGLTSLIHSFANDRGKLVAEYDGSVEEWVAEARKELAFTTINVTANVKGAANISISNGMQAASTPEIGFHDAEQERGILNYTPLRYTAQFEFDSYYPGNGSDVTDPWDLLPSREEAPTVEFRFEVRNLSGHVATFTTQPWPLVFDEVVRPRTPAPENRCRREHKGVWRRRHCHVVRSLTDVCLQVEHDERGSWRPHAKSRKNDTWDSKVMARAALTSETYGCDPKTAWHPALFKTDPCWAAKSRDGQCAEKFRVQRVSLVVRSARDPFIKAEELTDDTFNFGLSPTSHRTIGITMLFLGVLLCIVPAARLRDIVRRRSKGSEESRSLKLLPPQEEEGCRAEAGVYRVM